MDAERGVAAVLREEADLAVLEALDEVLADFAVDFWEVFEPDLRDLAEDLVALEVV